MSTDNKGTRGRGGVAREAGAREALLRDVVENPDDDAPRLAYADWLHGNGEYGRAAFIRTQIELARLAPDDPRRDDLEALERYLLGIHEGVWRAALPCVPDVEWGPQFRRGFVEEATVAGLGFAPRNTPEYFRRRCEAAFAAQPVRTLHLAHCTHFGVLASMPEASRLAGLTLSGTYLDEGWARGLAAYPNLRGIASLSLRHCFVDGGTVAALLASPALGGLAKLCLEGCVLRDGDVQQIAAQPGLRRIRSLDLLSCGFGDGGALALVESPNVGGLRGLCLRGMCFSDRVRECLLRRFPFVCMDSD